MDKSLCAKATADSEQPTPGYMFNEIGRITHASVDACRQLEDYLMKRLTHASVHVKLKSLRVIKHCCQHGHLTFRRDMQGKTATIKEMMQYRGAPDALNGDTFNRAVRDTAQDVMNAIFDTTTASEQLQSTGRMQGFGSEGGAVAMGSDSGRPSASSFGLGGIGGMVSSLGSSSVAAAAGQLGGPPRLESGAYSTGRMQGFGNPSFGQPSGEPTGTARLAAFATGLGESVVKLANKVPLGGAVGGALGRPLDEPYSGGSYSGPGAGGGDGGGGYGASAGGYGATAGSGAAYGSGYGGGAYGGSVAPSAGPWRPLGAQADARPPPPAPVSAPPPAPAPAAAARAQAESYASLEEKLVDEATAPGGVRATIPRDELRKLCASVHTLNAVAVAQHLEARLAAPEWQRRLKALCVLEALLKDGHPAVASHFIASLGSVLSLTACAQVSVQERARKVLLLLGHDGPELEAQPGGAGECAQQPVAEPAAASAAAPSKKVGGKKKKHLEQIEQPAGIEPS
jgi:hypothetical protein